jgi:hypothetical protein
MKMSVGVLDHYNVSTRKLDETGISMRTCLGSPTGHALHSISQEHGSTALAIPCCTLTTSRRPRSSSLLIQVSSIMSLSDAEASRQRSAISPKRESRTT